MEITAATGMVRMWRDIPPAHYIFKLDSFSLFLGNNIDRYETCLFESGGYKWKLSIYPNGNESRNVTGYMSLYLSIEDVEALPRGWEVNISFKFFLYNHISHKYLTFQAAEENTSRLYMLNRVVGFDKMVSLESMNNPTNGFLLEDGCILGAEVFVVKFCGRGECVSIIKDPPNNTFTWKITEFSQISEEHIYSEEFVVGKHKWKLRLHPKGNTTVAQGEYISLFLLLVDELPPDRKVYAEYVIRVWDENIFDTIELQGNSWFSGSESGWGFPEFLSLREFNNQSNPNLLNLEAQITLLSKHKDF